MDEKLKNNLRAVSIWIRLLYMLLFAVILYIAIGLFALVTIVQFLFSLITGEANTNVLRFSDVLSQYINQSLRFVTFLSDDKPFPFQDLPESDIPLDSEVQDENEKSVIEAEPAEVSEEESEKKSEEDK